MNAHDITELFTLQGVLARVTDNPVASMPEVLAALIDWKHANGSAPTPVPAPTPEPEPVSATTAKQPSRTKAKTADEPDSDF